MYKVLLADDETETRNLLVKYIRQKEPDIEVVGSVTNGEEALKAAMETHPDIVITDISMPVMNGLEFLKEARSRGIALKAAVISGYDEFEYAKEAISLGVTEYLLKPFSPLELKEVLDKMKMELDSQRQLLDNMKQLKEAVDSKDLLLKERTLREILEGTYEGEPSPAVLPIGQNYYCVCLVKLPFSLEDRDWDFGKQENVEELLDLIRGGYFHRDVTVAGLSFDKQGAILILGGMASAGQQFLYQVKKGLDYLRNSLDRYYGMKIMCVVGGIYDSWRKLSCSYQEALTLWRGTLAADSMVVAYGEKPEKQQEEKAEATDRIKAYKEEILLAVRMGQEKNAVDAMEELMKIYASLSGKKADYVSVSVEELVYAISGDMENQGISHEEAKLDRRFGSLSLFDIRLVLEDYLKRCCRLSLANRERFQTDRIVEDVKYLIEGNLSYENLTLEWLSSKLNFSANYIRQVFKQKTGESFMEYVIRKRMEKAGRLLAGTDMMIQDIAAECGYSNQRYFASSFKKYYDCTPTKFKAMMEEKR